MFPLNKDYIIQQSAKRHSNPFDNSSYTTYLCYYYLQCSFPPKKNKVLKSRETYFSSDTRILRSTKNSKQRKRIPSPIINSIVITISSWSSGIRNSCFRQVHLVLERCRSLDEVGPLLGKGPNPWLPALEDIIVTKTVITSCHQSFKWRDLGTGV